MGEVSGTADVSSDLHRVFRPTKGTTLVQDLTLLTAVEASIEPVDAHKFCPQLEEDWLVIFGSPPSLPISVVITCIDSL